ncbi:MAG: hypothetical protein H6585_04700 [Flavobacteriales bacterium]|nr:hypothetical protein [Flavobacteriales bacterium]
MQAMGGREAWDRTRHIGWCFFGSRHLLWDKYTGRVRIEHHKWNMLFLINVNDTTGRVFEGNQEITEPDTLKKLVDIGRQIWVNDSYWLVMPFKLLDPGVNLKYVGKDTTQDGKMTDVLELTFGNSVGYTPENKYRVYVDPETHLVSRWDYFANASMTEPSISDLWSGYKNYDGVLLSGGRGGRSLEDIVVFRELPDRVYEDTASVQGIVYPDKIMP